MLVSQLNSAYARIWEVSYYRTKKYLLEQIVKTVFEQTQWPKYKHYLYNVDSTEWNSIQVMA